MENFVKLNFHLGVFKTPFLNWNFYLNILHCFQFLFKDLIIAYILSIYFFHLFLANEKKKTAAPTFFLVKMSTSTTDLKNYRKIAPFSPCHFLWLGLSSRVTLLYYMYLLVLRVLCSL